MTHINQSRQNFRWNYQDTTSLADTYPRPPTMTCKIVEPFHPRETLTEGQERVTLMVVKESDIQLYKIFERSSGVSRFMTLSGKR